MSVVLPFDKKKDCCGCSMCANICPKKAITMKKDEYGFVYPVIDNSKCVKCGLCKKNCAYQNPININKSYSLKSYCAVSKNDKILLNSSSGGVFTSLANSFISLGGIVYGCSFEVINDILTPLHIRVNNIDDLTKLQGSKYVKSSICDIYQSLYDDLNKNFMVLFSGTPCQVAALKKYLIIKKVNLDNLFCIDIICHGTPSVDFFQGYVTYMQKKIKGKILDIKFRDKKYKWSLKGTILYNKNGVLRKKVIDGNMSSYYKYFLLGNVYMENCYSCKYANGSRVGDITIGDFWGIESEHPETLIENGGLINPKNGVSCIIVNSENGDKLINMCGSDLFVHNSTFEKICKNNKQLVCPSNLPNERNKILNIYKDHGYSGVEKYFFKHSFFKRYLHYFYYDVFKIKK